jgi:glyoxylase-like metal-dependent hydrolase (beta-lactamase superfamily II)
MEMITEGVHRVGGGYVSSYIVDGDEGVLLVDTGLPRRHGEIEAGLDEIGRRPSDVTAILLTHAHADHTGGAAHLRDATGAIVVASTGDAPAVRGDAPVPPPPIFEGALSFLTRLVPGAKPVTVDHEVDETRTHGLPTDVTVLETPGHTPGHVSYLLDRDGGVLFVGDAAIAKDGAVSRGFMNRSTPEWRASIAHIAEHDFAIACFGHSGPLPADASAAFARFAATF